MLIDRTKKYGLTAKEIIEQGIDYKTLLTNEKADFDDILFYEEIKELFPNQHLVVEPQNPTLLHGNDGYKILYYKCDKRFAEKKAMELDDEYFARFGYCPVEYVEILSIFCEDLGDNQILIVF